MTVECASHSVSPCVPTVSLCDVRLAAIVTVFAPASPFASIEPDSLSLSLTAKGSDATTRRLTVNATASPSVTAPVSTLMLTSG